MNTASRFMANPEVSVHKEKEGRALLYNADTGALTQINATGWIIWKHLQDDPRTKAEIVDRLRDKSENVPPEQAEADVEGFLKDLLDKGFIGEVMDEFSSFQISDQEHVVEKYDTEAEEVTDPEKLDPLEGWPTQPEGKVYPYRGSSMKGTFRPGDFVETVNCRPRNLRRGDVIVFRGSDTGHGKNLIVHRIVGIAEDGFITQGDNNRRPDAQPVPPNSIMGKVFSRERSGIHGKVIGGWPGLIKAKTKFFVRMAIHRIYSKTRQLWPKRLIGRVMSALSKSPVKAICLSTKEGPVVKWVWRNQTVAYRHGEKGPMMTTFAARCLLESRDFKNTS